MQLSGGLRLRMRRRDHRSELHVQGRSCEGVTNAAKAPRGAVPCAIAKASRWPLTRQRPPRQRRAIRKSDKSENCGLRHSHRCSLMQSGNAPFNERYAAIKALAYC